MTILKLLAEPARKAAYESPKTSATVTFRRSTLSLLKFKEDKFTGTEHISLQQPA
jgi:hypothetical protein